MDQQLEFIAYVWAFNCNSHLFDIKKKRTWFIFPRSG